MNRLSVAAFLIISAIYSFAQQGYQLYQFPQKLPPEYRFDARQQSEEIVSKGATGLKQKELQDFADKQAYTKKAIFMSGDVYISWENYEEYLNRILQKIIPEKYAADKNLHVYIRRSSDYNAITMHDGTIFFNVGALADITSEAALAIILGHEFAHYRYKHVLKSYKKEIKAKKESYNFDQYLDKEIANAEYGRDQELRADSLGIALAYQAGYDIRCGLNNFYTFLDFKKKGDIIKDSKKKKGDDEDDDDDDDESSSSGKKRKHTKKELERLLASHPDEADRIEQLEDMIADLKPANTAKWIVDDDIFEKLKSASRYESIAIDFEDFNFTDCVERTFIRYMLFPDDNTNLYYLQEAIRRDLLVNPNLKKKGFLSDEYKELFAKKTGALHYIPYIIRDSILFAAIKAKDLMDSTYEFETYSQAFTFFNSLARKRQITESYLSYILNLKNPQKLDSLGKSCYDDYNSAADAKHKEFLKSLKKNTLLEPLKENTENIVLVADVAVFDYKDGDVETMYYEESEVSTVQYFKDLKEFAQTKLPEYTFYSVYNMSLNRMQDKLDYLHIINATIRLKDKDLIENKKKDSDDDDDDEESATGTAAKTKKKRKKAKSDNEIIYNTNLFKLDPGHWEFFKDKKLQSVSYLKEFYVYDKDEDVIDENLKWNFCYAILIPPILPLYCGIISATGNGKKNSAALLYKFNPLLENENVQYLRMVSHIRLDKYQYMNNAYHILSKSK
jgi:hypothetical protein